MSFWRGRRVLVTGGAGFIGSNLVERLVYQGADVRVIDNLDRGKLKYLERLLNTVEFRQENLMDSEVCIKACQHIEVVFHLASKVGGIKYYLSKPSDILMHNTLIDTFVLQAAKNAGVSRYLYASSAHIYPIELQATPDASLIKEEQAIPAHPELSYGWAKLLGERQIEYTISEGADLRAAIVRIIGAYGPNQDIDLHNGSAIPVFIRRAIEYPKRKPFIVMGTGEETRSYCYVDDIVGALLLSVEKLDYHELVGPINVGREDRITIRDLAMKIIRVSGKTVEIVFDPSHPTVIWGQALDCSKAKQLLDGWEPQVHLEEGLRWSYENILERMAVAEYKDH